MRFRAYETVPQRVHTATGLGLGLSLLGVGLSLLGLGLSLLGVGLSLLGLGLSLLGVALSLVPLSCSSRTGFASDRFSFGHEWAGGGGKSLSFTGVLGQSKGQESQTYRNRFGKTSFFSSDIDPHRLYRATRLRLRVTILR